MRFELAIICVSWASPKRGIIISLGFLPAICAGYTSRSSAFDMQKLVGGKFA